MDPALPVLMPKSRGDAFSGWLQLEVGMIKAWENRFCELRGAELRYFAKEGDAKPKGTFVVTGATDVPEGINRIDIHGSAGKRRLLRVSAHTSAEKAAWLARFSALGGGGGEGGAQLAQPDMEAAAEAELQAGVLLGGPGEEDGEEKDEEEESKGDKRLATAKTAAGAASDAKALATAVQGGNLNGAVKAAIDLAEKAIALRDAKGKLLQKVATKQLAEASTRAAARMEAEGKSALGKVMAGMAKAASKIKTLEKFAHMIPLVGPTAGGMLHGLAQVCEVAARFQADGKEALSLMERVAQATEKVLASHGYIREEDAERVGKAQEDVEEVLMTARAKFIEVYGAAALGKAKRGYRAIFAGEDNVTFSSLEEGLRVQLVWLNDLLQTIQLERATVGGGEEGDELGAFLSAHKLGKYRVKLEELGADCVEGLLDLEDAHIARLGMAEMHEKRFRRALQALRGGGGGGGGGG